MKKILLILTIILSTSITVSATASPSAYAFAGEECRYFLGMPAWDCGVEENPENQDAITTNIITIASNIFTAITVLSAYLVLGFIIYGGYLYMFSSGDPAKATNSRKVLTRAFIGLAIVILSNVILNTIRYALIRNMSLADISPTDSKVTLDEANNIFTQAINWIIMVSGAVSLIFIVIGAVGYITSTGDPSKLQKAKNTLIYALIGLAVVILSAVISAFVSNLIRNAETETPGYINQTSIVKELYEK